MIDLADILTEPPKAPREVSAGPELHRILTLARRPIPDVEADESLALASFLTSKLSLSALPYPGPLLPIQALALKEAWENRGLFASLRVGAGKTLLSFLLPVVLQARCALYVCPGSIRSDVEAEFAKFRAHWRSGNLRILTYEKLSTPSSAEQRDKQGNITRRSILDRIAPDVVILDEAHRAGATSSTGTKRLGRYRKAHPEAVFVALSGTAFKRSIKDAAHLLEWCLGDRAPLPRTYLEREAWAGALDAHKKEAPTAPGALSRFEISGVTTSHRNAVARRIYETPGVLGSQEPPVSIPLRIAVHAPSQPDDALTTAYRALKDTWCLSDGTELSDGLAVALHARTIGLGFWNRWDPVPPADWRNARNEWARFCRYTLKTNRQNIDSEAGVAAAVRAGRVQDDGLLSRWLQARDAERARTGLTEPATVPVWVSDEAIHETARWVDTHHQLVWTASIGLGDRLARELRLPYYGPRGYDLRGRHITNHQHGPAIASFQANGTGRNLQRIWHKNLWLCCPTEQSLGRTHRFGQTKPVDNWLYVSVEEHLTDFQTARSVKATFAEEMLLAPQRLVYADVDLSYSPIPERGAK